ncbi:hypothetical protein [Pseudoalteromonas luteoviolacea]|uniref:Uncharacterized protein n=1 Tax=Pseudoalteromonas luteoviolacea (strain 2ta16) TaxID=1353533 RepID=V4HWN3_PSEL2|nr:hypothetical protein [Pseudoalteromonas luteoviolacea]ESP95250.1 hypothetical protein PL2TA16_03764 [Pseudoalteromonas luteoviolacea 2ta16]KZN37836.1 hypothetical protein N483_21100 [Pseudoalteromonas luteoviolacea NCIMB 1944]
MSKFLFSLLLLGVSAQSAFASNTELSIGTQITELNVYSRLGNADVYVKLDTNGNYCKHGYFINKNSAGYESILSSLLSAYHTQSNIKIYAFTGQAHHWSGNAGPTCEIYSVQFKR